MDHIEVVRHSSIRYCHSEAMADVLQSRSITMLTDSYLGGATMMRRASPRFTSLSPPSAAVAAAAPRSVEAIQGAIQAAAWMTTTKVLGKRKRTLAPAKALATPLSEDDEKDTKDVRTLVAEANERATKALLMNDLPHSSPPRSGDMRISDPAPFELDAITFARWILGKRIVRVLPDGQRLSGKIVECEAYLGEFDAAAHSYGLRRSDRNESMYQAGATLYIYLIYGLYHCMNIVCGRDGDPTAVLVRALEPEEGVEHMLSRRLRKPTKATAELAPLRPATEAERKKMLPTLCSGPGRLCQALGLERTHDRVDLLSSTEVFLEHGELVSGDDIVTGGRVGVEYSGRWSKAQLRFALRNNAYVSKPWPWVDTVAKKEKSRKRP